jgi:hypothetical protein
MMVNTIEIVPLDPTHVDTLVVQGAQKEDPITINRQYAEAMLACGRAWSAMYGQQCIGCAGIADAGLGRGIAWAVLSADAGKHMIAITREARKNILASGFKRVELTVIGSFGAAHRWARLLGFHLETPHGMRYYYGNNELTYLYARY